MDALVHQLLLLFSQLMLPLFMMALLLSLCGVSPEIVVRAFGSIAASLINGVFGLLRALIEAIFGKRSSTRRSSPKTPSKRGGGRGDRTS